MAFSINDCLEDHCVGWAKRSVPNIKAEKLLAGHPNGIFVRWARFALPNLRQDSFTFLVLACPV
jgi:hypothetical protein